MKLLNFIFLEEKNRKYLYQKNYFKIKNLDDR